MYSSCVYHSYPHNTQRLYYNSQSMHLHIRHSHFVLALPLALCLVQLVFAFAAQLCSSTHTNCHNEHHMADKSLVGLVGACPFSR